MFAYHTKWTKSPEWMSMAMSMFEFMQMRMWMRVSNDGLLDVNWIRLQDMTYVMNGIGLSHPNFDGHWAIDWDRAVDRYSYRTINVHWNSNWDLFVRRKWINKKYVNLSIWQIQQRASEHIHIRSVTVGTRHEFVNKFNYLNLFTERNGLP